MCVEPWTRYGTLPGLRFFINKTQRMAPFPFWIHRIGCPSDSPRKEKRWSCTCLSLPMHVFLYYNTDRFKLITEVERPTKENFSFLHNLETISSCNHKSTSWRLYHLLLGSAGLLFPNFLLYMFLVKVGHKRPSYARS